MNKYGAVSNHRYTRDNIPRPRLGWWAFRDRKIASYSGMPLAGRLVQAGKTYRIPKEYNGMTLTPCQYGLHYSYNLLKALKYISFFGVGIGRVVVGKDAVHRGADNMGFVDQYDPLFRESIGIASPRFIAKGCSTSRSVLYVIYEYETAELLEQFTGVLRDVLRLKKAHSIEDYFDRAITKLAERERANTRTFFEEDNLEYMAEAIISSEFEKMVIHSKFVPKEWRGV